MNGTKDETKASSIDASDVVIVCRQTHVSRLIWTHTQQVLRDIS